MRVLGIGDTCDLGALYLRLVQEGHEVRVSIANPLCHGILAGLVARTDDWHRELDWVRGGGRDGIILFENVAKERGALQDALRRDGYQVIGGSAYGDRLENDRAHAMEVLAGVGMSIAPVFPFSDRRAVRSGWWMTLPPSWVVTLSSMPVRSFRHISGAEVETISRR